MDGYLTFDRYCSDEAVRQTLRGHRVPHANTPVAYAQWLAHARTVWDAANRQMTSSTTVNPLSKASPPQGEVPFAAYPLPSLSDIEKSTASLLRFDGACEVTCRFPPMREIEALLQSYEVLLRIFFHGTLAMLRCTASPDEKLKQNPFRPSAHTKRKEEDVAQHSEKEEQQRTALRQSMKSTQSAIRSIHAQIQQLEQDGAIGPQPDRFCHLYVLNELYSFYRLMRCMDTLPVEKRRVLIQTSRLMGRRYRGEAFEALLAALDAIDDSNDAALAAAHAHTHQLVVAGLQSATTVPWQFPSVTAPALRLVFPDAAEPVATLATDASTNGDDSTTSASNQAQAADDEIESVDTKSPKVMDVSSAASFAAQRKKTAVVLHTGPMAAALAAPIHQRSAKRTRDDSPDCTLGEVVRLSGGHAAPEGPERSKFQQKAAAQQPQPQQQQQQHRPAAVVVRATAANPYPCRSKYHSRFVNDSKHASRECDFCTVCHMLEFLFNGCKFICCWKHEPTPRKIQQHLRQYPAICRLAEQRMLNWARGIFPDPIELP